MLLALLVGCLFDRATYERRLNELTDHDGDGFAYEDDCDDDNVEISPDVVELCDGLDQDCDGEIDDGFAGRAETCDGVDEDCDGVIDDDVVDGTTWYGDADGDEHGLATVVTTACLEPDAYSADGDDCDDGNGAKYPGATEVPYDGIDQDCSGADLVDVDGDGAAAEAAGGDDCDDADPTIYPSAAETWEDGFVDNDCVEGNEGVRVEYAATWLGQTDEGQFGYRLGALADLDGDGREEFWASPLFDARFGTWGGAVYVMNADSKTDLTDAGQLTPDIERTFLGVSGGVGPDVDGNGALDAVFGGDGHDGGRGAAWILDSASLAAGGTVALPGSARAWVLGEEPSSYLAHDIAVLPDFSGDGSSVLAVTLRTIQASWAQNRANFFFSTGRPRAHSVRRTPPVALKATTGAANSAWASGRLPTSMGTESTTTSSSSRSATWWSFFPAAYWRPRFLATPSRALPAPGPANPEPVT